MSTQSELALIYLIGGLGLVLIVFLLIGVFIYAWHRSRKRRVHIDNATITNKNFDSQPKYNKTTSNEYVATARSPNIALAQHFHHEFGISKKTFEAPSAPLTPPSSSSSTDETVDIESKVLEPQTTGSLTSVIIIDSDDNEYPDKAEKTPVLAHKRPETAPSVVVGSRERNFSIDIPETKAESRHSSSSDGRHISPRPMEKLQEHDERLYSEFNTLSQEEEPKPSNEGQTLKNIRRNRYYDILPYDENRVKLVDHFTDYINASYIREGDGSVQYIAAQGPIGEPETGGGRRDCTIVDFWHMIWQEEINCIVMLTQCVENGRVGAFTVNSLNNGIWEPKKSSRSSVIEREATVSAVEMFNVQQKCGRYWPQNVDEDERIDDKLSMKLYCYTEDEISLQREIWLEKRGDGTRKITQWHFKNWNDAEGPKSNEDFLTFVENIRKSAKNAPILVHCSAGVGRTGVYVGLDILLNKLESESIIDVKGTVHSLRMARGHMVQNINQYLTLYELIAMAIKKRMRTTRD